jgi:molybdopterin-containing oxidoreductase family iron-sulfur binding subunit
MADSPREQDGRSSYWRSLRELHAPDSVNEAKAREFMEGVTGDFTPEALPAMSRKQFLALLSASAAFAAAGCTNYRDKGEIVPYTKNPEEIVPGVSTFYASTCTGCAQACGVLVTTREGRPVKIDGNPDHPLNGGSVCARGQAGILGLYDPSRLRAPQRGSSTGRGGELGWDEADREVRKALDAAAAAGRQIALITHPQTSPTARRVLAEFAVRYPTARRYTYDMNNDRVRRSAWQRCTGLRALPAIRWEDARVILALESDILGTEGATVEQIRRFARGRDVAASGRQSRLYAVEGTLSLTGANADYRLRLRPDAQTAFVLALVNELSLQRGAFSIGASASRMAAPFTLKNMAARHGLDAALLARLADDLLENRGRAIIHAGDTLDETVHVAVNLLNDLLGNSALYAAGDGIQQNEDLTPPEEWDALVRGMKDGSVSVVIHAGANPVYHLPPALGYEAALRAVPVSVSLGESEDETGALCTLVLPVHTMLESWGDHQVRAGVVSLQQPVIAPLYGTRQREAILRFWASGEQTFREEAYHAYLMARWQADVYPPSGSSADFRSFWLAGLHDGLLLSGTQPVPVAPVRDAAFDGLPAPADASTPLVLQIRASHFMGAGELAGNGWLQELPHPVSKVVWDNYAAVSPAMAKELGVSMGDAVEVTLPHGTQTFPVMVQPGHAEGCITVEAGYGRWNAGPVGSGVGRSTAPLMTLAALTGPRLFREGVLRATGEHLPLVSTQEHHALDDTFVHELHLKRKIVQEGTVIGYQKDPEFLHHGKHDTFSISKEVTYEGVKWAMSVDMNKCVGCNACVASCNVENNIPVVGKDQVEAGREMHWLRIDRYYAGTPEDVRVSHQPMLCQHCDQAPCENVCPVVATTHSPDGLNQMAYNRCVGTKYCSNNCPYKVRRFNFYDFRDRFADGFYEQDPVGLVHNPEVTVRSRGVMEKCTFCIQRIMAARQHAVEEGRPLSGNDVRTACQQACPAEAITFGDMNDPESAVSKARAHNLGYHVLEEFNARPNVTYLARLRNTHPETAS